MDRRASILSHLVEEYREPIKDPVWRNIPLSRTLLRMVAHPAFQKLNGIKQLGPTYLVYPGATHTRLNHSLGVFHLARRMMLHLCMGAGPMFDSYANRPRPLGQITLEGTKAFLCAALMHDLGHYPYAHSLKELKVRSHESLTAERLQYPDLSALIREELGVDPELVAAIVDPSLEYPAEGEVAFFRNLLSGVLDPDKLDYLNRDAYFCGVPHGIQDVDFALAEIRLHPQGIAITEKGLSAVESILFSKYLMYKTVYWHKTVRIATAMIKKVVLLALRAGVLQPEDLYWLDDQEFYSLTSEHPFPPFALVRRVVQRKLFKLVASVPFSTANDHHRQLQSLDRRLDFEEELGRRAGARIGRKIAPESLIVDIPEPINFDIHLPVLRESSGEEVPYDRSRSVFSRASVQAFAGTLRTVSLIADAEEDLVQALMDIGVERILNEGLGVRS
jgi:HD superfamily phosphohydrolase